MLVVVTQGGVAHQVRVSRAEEGEEPEPTLISAEVTEEEKEAPNPILPTGQELAYAVVGFALLFFAMRYWLFPKLRRGMDARDAHIRAGHEDAEALRSAVAAEAAAYEAGIAEARAEAAKVLDAARAEVDADRQRKVAAVNARIAEAKAAATQADDAAKAGVMGQVEDAVADVASTMASRVLGRPIDAGSVRGVVSEVVNAGVAR